MTATVSAIKAALGQRLNLVSGIKRVYAMAPVSLPPADLPAAVIYTGAATYTESGWSTISETREYLVRLYIASLQQGLSGEVETMCEGFLATLRAAFPPGLRLADASGGRLGVLETRVLGDQGVSILQLGGVAYMGIELRLEVTQ